MKSEPDVFSIDDLRKRRHAPWDGVRNYQARNFMRDKMKTGDLILIYHSSTQAPGVAGLARVCREAYPDSTAWDRKSEYFDPASNKKAPRWVMVDVEFVEKFPRVVSLDEMKNSPNLEGMHVVRRGMRLSIQPVAFNHFEIIKKMGRGY
jgi:predicted RNA-binding protein with PUA-like domain